MLGSRWIYAVLAAATACLLASSVAQAAPDCAGAAAPKTILSGQGVLESVVADPRGRLFYTDTGKNAVMRLDKPGGPPVVAADGISKPGGMLIEPDGTLIVGQGDGFQEGAMGNLSPVAALVRVDPDKHTVTPLVQGLAMANGLARGPDGAIYASNDAGAGIDRVLGTTVQNRWAQVVSSNGLAVDAAGQWLYAAQTFQPAAVQRVSIADPTKVELYAQPGPDDMSAGPDGMTIDQSGRLFIAANGGGEVWRVDTDRSVCTLARGLLLPSAVGFGAGGEFPSTSLYAVTFSGNVVELPAARAAPPSTSPPATRLAPRARLRVGFAPRRVRAGRSARVRVRVERLTDGKVSPIRGATVRIGNLRRLTPASGRIVVRLRPRRAGRLSLRVAAPGFPAYRATLRVLAR